MPGVRRQKENGMAKKATSKKRQTPKPIHETSPSGDPTPSPPQEASNVKTQSSKRYDMSKVVDAVFSSLVPDPPVGSSKARDKVIREYVLDQIKASPISDKYNILILHDEGRMVKSDADNIYSAATTFTEKRPLMLVLYSTGGVVGSAYLIGKLCREYANDKFIVVVPRQA